MVQENDEMRGRDKQQRQQLDLMEETQHTLARKNASCQQVGTALLSTRTALYSGSRVPT